MAEEIITAAAAPVASTSVEAAPAAAVTAPVTPVIETPAVAVTTPVTETVTQPVAPTPEVKTEATAETAKPLLSAEEPKTEAPKDAPKTEGTEQPTEAVKLPVYEFKLPEGLDANNPTFKTFQSKLGEFQNLSKVDQAAVQKFGQELIDMRMADVNSVLEAKNKADWDWFNNRNKEWLETAKKDPTIGGENFDQTINAASQAIRLYGGTKAQQIETAKLLQETGVENSPVMLRFLSNITKIAAKEGQPISGSNAPMQKAGIAELMYGGRAKA